VSTREALIVLAHAHLCERCRERLLDDPQAVSRGRALTEEEKSLLSELKYADFATLERLSEASGYDTDELSQFHDHPVARLRHF
jgi:hypothetical protein